MLSGLGVVIAVATFLNRDKPAWQRDVRRLFLLALLQVALGSMWAVLSVMR